MSEFSLNSPDSGYEECNPDFLVKSISQKEFEQVTSDPWLLNSPDISSLIKDVRENSSNPIPSEKMPPISGNEKVPRRKPSPIRFSLSPPPPSTSPLPPLSPSRLRYLKNVSRRSRCRVFKKLSLRENIEKRIKNVCGHFVNASTVYLYQYNVNKIKFLVGKRHRTKNEICKENNVQIMIPHQMFEKSMYPICITGLNEDSLLNAVCEVENIIM